MEILLVQLAATRLWRFLKKQHMVEIHLYGQLRRYAADPRPDRESVVRLAPQPGETVGTLLARLGLLLGHLRLTFLAYLLPGGLLLPTVLPLLAASDTQRLFLNAQTLSRLTRTYSIRDKITPHSPTGHARRN